MKNEKEKKQKNKNLKKSILICCLVSLGLEISILAIITPLKFNKIENEKMQANYFDFYVVSKRNDVSDSMYTNGRVIGFNVTLENNSSLIIKEFKGNMKISLASFSYDYNYDFTLYDYVNGIKAYSKKNFLITIDSKATVKVGALYNTPINKLQIEFKLNQISFDNNKTKTYEEEYKIIKPFGSYGGKITSDEQDTINKENYEKAVSLFKSKKYEEALEMFEKISFYKDSSEYIKNCNTKIIEIKYQSAVNLMNEGNYDEAIKKFELISEFKDSKTLINECKYKKAKKFYDTNDLVNSYKLFMEIKTYKDSSTFIDDILKNINYAAEKSALNGDYENAINLLESIGLTNQTSPLYNACNYAIKGYYTKFVNLLNPTKVIVNSGLTYLPDEAFKNCNNILQIVLPDTLLKIGNFAFSGCSKLVSINLNDNIDEIGNRAFEYCTSLTSFKVPSKLKVLGSNVLTGCSNLEKITTKIINNYYIQSFFTSTPTSVRYDVSWPSKFSEIIITEGTIISNSFFSFLPNTIKEIVFKTEIVEVKEKAFYNSEVGFYLPKTVKKINDYSYAGLGYLGETITLHEGLEYIGSGCFSESNFKTINIPGTIKYIGNDVFSTLNHNGILEKINFNGTKKEWLSIVSSSRNYGMRDYYDVECTDAIYHYSRYGNETGWKDK